MLSLLVIPLFLLIQSPFEFVRADVQPFTSYANDFVDPDYIAAGMFPNATEGARDTIVSWAEFLSASGPWSVTDKPFNAPSGDPKDYMSWAPYYWPDCTGVGNTTVLTPQQIWVTCPYVERDGQFNPDRYFFNVSDSVLYNALAHSFQNASSSVYSQNIVKFIDAWFLNNSTGMNPNLNYAQMERGPKGQLGTHTGVLDLKGMVKIVSGILILRKLNCTDWTEAIDTQMNTWTTQYLTWLQTNKIGTEECAALNNHGSFCFNQLSALKLLVNDIPGSINASNTFFQGIYQGQINSTGDQPFEAIRTHPYHYRNYNLGAMITNARILKFTDPSANPWNITTKDGTTIQDALNFVMTVNYNTSGEAGAIEEIYPNIAAVASEYGDPTGKYVAFLQKDFPDYAWDADFLWDQPLAGSALVAANATDTGTTEKATSGAPPGGLRLSVAILTLVFGIMAVVL
ncbi:chondroitin AC/alginate lyase [Mycena galopus ATCC 62051]|nr:chondroitin AC/alginate lyase [Mycena galopus ATCC 62051]